MVVGAGAGITGDVELISGVSLLEQPLAASVSTSPARRHGHAQETNVASVDRIFMMCMLSLTRRRPSRLATQRACSSHTLASPGVLR
jgi:hypothetical protein